MNIFRCKKIISKKPSPSKDVALGFGWEQVQDDKPLSQVARVLMNLVQCMALQVQLHEPSIPCLGAVHLQQL